MCQPIDGYHIATNALFINSNCEQAVIQELLNIPYVASATVVSKYININIKPEYMQYWKFNLDIGKNVEVNVEYCSPNPTGPLHLGHLRTTMYGYSIAELFKYVGYNVTTEMYINNYGKQFMKFVNSVRHHHDPNQYPLAEDDYKGEYVKEYASMIPRGFTSYQLCDFMVHMFQRILATRLNVKHMRVAYEDKQYDNTVKAVEILKSKGHIRYGALRNQKSEGDLCIVYNLPTCPEFSIGRSDGSFTYAGLDIGYAYGKTLGDATTSPCFNIFCCLGEDHIGHIPKLTETLKCIDERINFVGLYTGIVKFKRNGVTVKMSKRNNDFITLEEMLDEVSVNALLQTFFSYKEHSPVDIELSSINENQIYDLVYVHKYMNTSNMQQEYLDDTLIKYIVAWDAVVRTAFHQKTIHIIYSYATELCHYIRTNNLTHKKLPKLITHIIDSCICILNVNAI